jgi:hypothetical protein
MTVGALLWVLEIFFFLTTLLSKNGLRITVKTDFGKTPLGGKLNSGNHTSKTNTIAHLPSSNAFESNTKPCGLPKQCSKQLLR